jgi:hypothetical protein
MVRKNLGFENPNYEFSVRYLAEQIIASKTSIVKGLKGLIEKGSIYVVGQKNRGTRLFKINWIEPNFTPAQPTADPPVQISYPEPPPAPPAVPHPDQPDEISYRDIIEGGVMAKIPCENKVSAEDRAWLTDQVMAFDEDFVRQQIDYTNKKISKKGKEQPKIYFAYLRTRINQENFEKYSAAAGLIEKPKAVTTPLHNLKSGTVFEIIDTGERGKIDEQFGIMSKGTLLPIRVTELFNQGKLKIISEPKEVSQPKQFSRHDLPVFKSM